MNTVLPERASPVTPRRRDGWTSWPEASQSECAAARALDEIGESDTGWRDSGAGDRNWGSAGMPAREDG